MKQYYECHITMIGDPQYVIPMVEFIGWKFSAINGDPDLGEGIKCYATRQFNGKYTKEFILDLLNEAATEISKNEEIQVIRKKIEFVIYDERIKPINDSDKK